jgi:hypothetical protein
LLFGRCVLGRSAVRADGLAWVVHRWFGFGCGSPRRHRDAGWSHCPPVRRCLTLPRHLDGHLWAPPVSADAGPDKADTPARPTITGRNRSLSRMTLLGSTNGTEAGAAESEQTHQQRLGRPIDHHHLFTLGNVQLPVVAEWLGRRGPGKSAAHRRTRPTSQQSVTGYPDPAHSLGRFLSTRTPMTQQHRPIGITW